MSLFAIYLLLGVMALDMLPGLDAPQALSVGPTTLGLCSLNLPDCEQSPALPLARGLPQLAPLAAQTCSPLPGPVLAPHLQEEPRAPTKLKYLHCSSSG